MALNRWIGEVVRGVGIVKRIVVLLPISETIPIIEPFFPDKVEDAVVMFLFFLFHFLFCLFDENDFHYIMMSIQSIEVYPNKQQLTIELWSNSVTYVSSSSIQ